MLRSDQKKQSALDRKLDRIEREKRALEQEMKSLSRAVKRGQMVLPNPTEYSPVELPKGSSRTAPLGTAVQSSPAGKKQPVRGDARFANYFSTGGLKTPLPSRKGRAVERNKLVFIVIVAVVLIFIIVSIFSS